MPKYYNKNRSPLPLELPSGSTVVPGKSYIDIPIHEEGCASVIRCVQKGLLLPPRNRDKDSSVGEDSKPKLISAVEVKSSSKKSRKKTRS